MKFETLKGELHWVFCKEPRLGYKATPSDPDKHEWSVMLRPDQESLMKIMDMQALGVKNKLSKDDTGQHYQISFKRPTQTVNKKTGAVLKTFQAPQVFQADGATILEELVGNGSKGFVKIELYEHNAPGGKKAHAARLDSVCVTDLVPYSA